MSNEQPMPNKVDGPAMQDLVIEDIQKRKQVGIERYGTTLKAFNGRNSLQDAYEESVDQTFYLKQASIEHDALVAALAEARKEVDAWRNCFICPECGRGKVDEDGCCTTCGRDCMGFENGLLVRGISDHFDSVERMLEEITPVAEAANRFVIGTGTLADLTTTVALARADGFLK